jgi:Tn3 transposase DDE domain
MTSILGPGGDALGCAQRGRLRVHVRYVRISGSVRPEPVRTTTRTRAARCRVPPRTEARHSLARRIFFGQRGERRPYYREGMEDQLGALGLALNAVVLFNSLYIDTRELISLPGGRGHAGEQATASSCGSAATHHAAGRTATAQ